MITSRVKEGEACNSHILAVPRNDSVIALIPSALHKPKCAQTNTPCCCCSKMPMRAVCLQGRREPEPQALMQVHHHAMLSRSSLWPLLMHLLHAGETHCQGYLSAGPYTIPRPRQRKQVSHEWVPQFGPHRDIVPCTDPKIVVVEVELEVAASQGGGLARCGVDVRGVLLWQACHWVPRHAQRLIILSDIVCGVPVLNLHALQKSVRANIDSGGRRRTSRPHLLQ